MRALVESPAELADRPARVIAVVSILDDKDAAAMLRALLPLSTARASRAVQNPRALPPPTLSSLSPSSGAPAERRRSCPTRARRWPRPGAGRPGGLVVATGSIYLIADLLSPAGRRAASSL